MAFATTEDVADRLGRVLSAGEEQSITFLLDGATAVIALAAGSDSDDIDPVPDLLRFLAVELACRALANPNSLDSLQEQIGQANYSARFRDAGLMLTRTEELLVSQAVNGTLSGSSTPRALQDRLIDLNEGRDVDEEP